MKVFLFGTPCTGKTTFIKKQKNKYRDFTLLDCDNYMIGEKDYRKIEQVMPDYSIYFGGIHNPFSNQEYFDSIIGLTVIIPLQELERNVEYRKQKLGVWTGPFAHLNSIIHDSNFGRNVLIEFSRKLRVPIFSSISQAIDSLYFLNY